MVKVSKLLESVVIPFEDQTKHSLGDRFDEEWFDISSEKVLDEVMNIINSNPTYEYISHTINVKSVEIGEEKNYTEDIFWQAWVYGIHNMGLYHSKNKLNELLEDEKKKLIELQNKPTKWKIFGRSISDDIFFK